MVVCGTADADWFAVGLSGEDQLVVKHVQLEGAGGTTVRNLHRSPLPAALCAGSADGEAVPLEVRVSEDGTLTLRVGDPTSAEVLVVPLPEPPPGRASVGILVKDADLRLEDLRVEYLP